jgi:cell division protein FtsX
MNVVKLKEKLTRTAAKATQKFRRGDHEKRFIGAWAALIAIGASSYLGNTINNMVGSLTGGGAGGASGIASFVNDVVTLIGIISVILGIVEYRRLRKQIFK